MSADLSQSTARATDDPGPAGWSTATRRIAGRGAVAGLIAGLTLYHGQLLGQRIADLTLLEPFVALRWGAAALMVFGLVHLQRSGVSLVWGRRALILWLLVLLLHAGSVPAVDVQLLAEPGLLLTLPLWAFALRVVLGERRGAGGVPSLAFLPAFRDRPARPPREPGLLAPLSPRAPPAPASL